MKNERPRFQCGDKVRHKNGDRLFWVESDSFDDICPVNVAAIDNPRYRFLADQSDLTPYTDDVVDKKSTGEQTAPVPNSQPAVWSLVIRDMADRDLLGTRRYGTRLQPNNGRDALLDAYQEALDLVAYLRQEIYQRDGK